ncbi:MAG TPA: radical SAM protein [Blastocatellia bacterium]|nr:radical SAM protein [Blastocatellia bacterium]
MHDIPLESNVFSPNKLFTHMDRMYEWWQGKNVFPITLELSPTTICNHFCTWCMHGAYFGKHKGDKKELKLYPDSSMMQFDFYRGLIDEVVPLGAKAMIFSGSGEPFVNPDFPNFVEYTKMSGMDVSIITNGSLCDDESIPVAIKHSTWIRISLNAGTAKTRAKIHQVPEKDWDITLENMRKLSAEKKRTGSSVHLGSQIVVEPNNWEEVYETAQVSKECGMDYLQVKPVIMHPMSSDKQFEEEFFRKALVKIYEAKKAFDDDHFKVFVKEDQFVGVLSPDYERSHYKECYANFFPIIEANKLVYYCSQTRGLPEFAVGDLSKNTFKEIWDSSRRKHVNENIDISKCQPICRCHQINKTLWAIKHPKNGPNFV